MTWGSTNFGSQFKEAAEWHCEHACTTKTKFILSLVVRIIVSFNLFLFLFIQKCDYAVLVIVGRSFTENMKTVSVTQWSGSLMVNIMQLPKS